jgi:hypothetical protein
LHIFTKANAAVLSLLLGSAVSLCAQEQARLDVGVTYLAQRSIKADTTENFWMQGGSIELGADVWKGLGFGLNISGSHAGFIGSSNVPLSLQTITVGPRYRCIVDTKSLSTHDPCAVEP